MIPIFVGYDPREIAALHVFCHSILEKAREEVAFFPITGKVQGGDATNLFSHERWGIPGRMNYRGWAVYAECDMLCRAPIDELWDLRESAYDVLVAKHDYKTKHPIKYWGQKNRDYPRKNWSSLMLINCAGAVWQRIPWIHPEIGDLHRFSATVGAKALFAQDRVGELDLAWNWLVGEYDFNPAAKLVHFTIGGPYFDAYRNCDYAEEWRRTRDRMLHVKPYVAEGVEA